MQEDCDLPNKDLAYKLDVDAATVSRSKRALKADGSIKAYKAILDPEKFGLDTLAYIQVALEDTSKSKVDETVKFLAGRAEVQEIHHIHGEFDLFIKVRFRRNSEILEFVQQMLTKENNITDTNTIFIFGTAKDTTDIAI